MRYFSVVLIVVLSLIGFCGFTYDSVLFNSAKILYDDVVLIDYDKNYETVKINNLEYEDLIKQLSVNVYKIINLEDRIIIEGYTNKIKRSIVTNNIKTNIQFSICDDYFLVGSPLIKNSF